VLVWASETSVGCQVVTAVMCAGLYPNLIEVRLPDEQFMKTIHGTGLQWCPFVGISLHPCVLRFSVAVANNARDIRYFVRNQGLCCWFPKSFVDIADLDPDGSSSRVFLHPRSVNFDCNDYESPWMVYLTMVGFGPFKTMASYCHSTQMQTAKVYVHDCTMVWPYALLLFGGSIGIARIVLVLDFSGTQAKSACSTKKASSQLTIG